VSDFAAIILICIKSVTQDACDETNAVDVLSKRVSSELGCATEVIARGALREGLASDTYIKTVCRRIPDGQ
jgi:hypothetical protein